MQDTPALTPSITFSPIGTIRSPYSEPSGMPIQPAGAQGIKGTVVLREEFRAGLRDLDGFSRIILIYAFHRCTGYSLEVVPFLDTQSHGIFATRAPKRPNAIGLSIVRLVRINGCELEVEDIDILDGTPLLDIKPYVPAFDCFPDERAGWFGDCSDRVAGARADTRFSSPGNRTPDNC
jgi:tRNA (adenine37-N6)-methyltransferase